MNSKLGSERALTARRWVARAVAVLVLGGLIAAVGVARAEEDPFAAGVDALAVKEGDGSASLRAKLKLTKMEPDMLVLQVQALDDSAYPDCVVTAKVLMAAEAQDKAFRLIAAGKTYRFVPLLKRGKGRVVDLKDAATQSNLGACYYPKGTRLVAKVTGTDFKTKTFQVAALYLKP
ncbi:MAG: hypothetical protein IPG96_09250 [Proteobacteria bacterium]|nr:hypothetical protein [Pseudomonadota bacterium]